MEQEGNEKGTRPFKKLAITITGMMLASSASAASITLYFSGTLASLNTKIWNTTSLTFENSASPYTDRVVGDTVTGKIVIGVPDTYSYYRDSNGGRWDSFENFTEFSFDPIEKPAYVPVTGFHDEHEDSTRAYRNSDLLGNDLLEVKNDELKIPPDELEVYTRYYRRVTESASLYLKQGSLNRAFLPNAVLEANLENLLSTDRLSKIEFNWYLYGWHYPSRKYSSYVKSDGQIALNSLSVAPVPLPAAAWLFMTGLIGLVGVSKSKRRRKHQPVSVKNSKLTSLKGIWI